MKKLATLFITALLLFVMLTTIPACKKDSLSINMTESQSNVLSSCNHNWEDATCTSPKTCSICGEINGDPLGHTTSTSVCTRCNQNFGQWEIRYYVDEFGLPTSTPYITNIQYIVGTFNNSATTKSKLYAYFLIDSEDIAIVLLEYGSQKVKSYSTNDYTIIMLDTQGQRHTMYGTMYKNGDRVFVNENYKNTVLNALKQSGSISFYLEYSEYTLSSYLFTVETSNFKELYRNL